MSDMRWKMFVKALQDLDSDKLQENRHAAQECDDMAEKDFAGLEASFCQMRTQATKGIRDKISRLKQEDPDNPVFSRVSLYGPLDYGRLETAHTNTLAWILDPCAAHGYGGAFLCALLHTLDSRLDFSGNAAIRNVSVMPQRYHKTAFGITGYIDIWAEGVYQAEDGESPVPWLVVIECKIDHVETGFQLNIYEDAAKIWKQINRDGRIYYLFVTDDKRKPIRATQRWEPLSYVVLFAAFWRVSRKKTEAPGYQFLRLYLAGLLRDLHEWPLPLSENATINPYEATLLFDDLPQG